MRILKDYEFFRSCDGDRFMKIATKDFVFSKKDIMKHFEQYDKDELSKQKEKEKAKDKK